jgi:HAD superfamily hydrolase (TIGR01662 family)
VEPTRDEGFSAIEKVEVETVWGKEYVNRAIFLDLDGTVRVTPDEKVCPWPRNVDEVKVRPGCGALIKRYQQEGWLIFAVTNQSGPTRKLADPKYVSERAIIDCIQATESLLGVNFDGIAYATDRGGPPSSFWRKPCPGMGVMFIEEHKLDPAQCVMVGDMTSDKTFATRCGFQFQWAKDFFGFK